MRPARVVLSMLLAIAIAVLPVIGGAVSVVKAVESATATMIAPDDDCCEHGNTPGDAQDHHGAMDDCASLAACAAKCFSYISVAAGEATYIEIAVATLTIASSLTPVSHTDPPPFPPPIS